MVDFAAFDGFIRDPADHPVADKLWRGQSIGRIAVAVTPSEERVRQLRQSLHIKLNDPQDTPRYWTPEWRTTLEDQLYKLCAGLEIPGDQFLRLEPPRSVHSQSQSMLTVFGARVEPQADGLYFAHPLPPDPDRLDALEPGPLEDSDYWNAVRWIEYARQATCDCVPFSNSVLGGPLDTVNNLLGSTVLLEWLYTEPKTVHRLLEKVTGVLITVLGALRRAAGGAIHPAHFACLGGGFDVTSEVRSIISLDMYEEFEAPYLREIGHRLGPYAVHACGSWERTVPSVLTDPNFRAMHGQIRENDLATLCRLSQGKIALAIGRSVNLPERYLWSDTESFLRHVAQNAPDSQPLEITIREEDLPLWRQVRG